MSKRVRASKISQISGKPFRLGNNSGRRSLATKPEQTSDAVRQTKNPSERVRASKISQISGKPFRLGNNSGRRSLATKPEQTSGALRQTKDPSERVRASEISQISGKPRRTSFRIHITKAEVKLPPRAFFDIFSVSNFAPRFGCRSSH